MSCFVLPIIMLTRRDSCFVIWLTHYFVVLCGRFSSPLCVQNRLRKE